MSRFDAANIAFLVTVLAILVLRPVALALGLVDRPGGRKVHVGHIPIIGGICMFAGLVVSLRLVEPSIYGQEPFLVAAGLLVAIGAIDDRFELSAQARLMAHGIAALILTLGAGVVATNLGDVFFLGPVPLGVLALPFTVLVAMTVINAYNVLDGIDGLAAGVALASILCLATGALLFQSDTGLTLSGIAVATLFAFLLFNFPMALNRSMRTFMGDAGSTLLGLIVAWLGLRLTTGAEPIIAPVVALWIVAIPVCDLFISFGRRLARGQNPMSADRGHFHHILQRAGLQDREVVLVMTGMSLLIGLAGLFAHRAGAHDGLLFLALLGICWGQYLLTRRAWRVQRWIRRRRRRVALRS